MTTVDDFQTPANAAFNGARAGWLIDQYLASCAGRTAAISIKKYGQKLTHFRRWAAGYQAIGKADMAEFAEYLGDIGIMATTANDVVSRVRQMFRWAYQSGTARSDYSLWLPVIKAPRTIFKPVTTADVQALLDACNHTRYALRNKAMIALLAGAGLRLDEMCNVAMDDCTFDPDGLLVVRVKSGKGSKSRSVIVERRWASIIRAWCAELGYSDGPLMPSQKITAEHMTPCGAHNEFKKLAAKAGVKCACHDLRRFYATQWMKRYPGRTDELRRQMGHSDFSTTSIYVLIAGEDIKSLLRCAEEPTIDGDMVTKSHGGLLTMGRN